MTNQCAAQGCGMATKGFGIYCNAHSKRNIRHGHPLQLGITKGDLTGYRKEVRRFLDGRADREAWDKATDRLRLVAERCVETVRLYEGGRAMNRWEVQAARLFLSVWQDVDPKTIIETAAAMGMMLQSEPGRFWSDKAFLAQVARRFAGLTDRNAGTWWNDTTQQVHRVYRDIAPRTAVILGRTVHVAVGVIGCQIVKVQTERERAEREARNAMFAALASGEAVLDPKQSAGEAANV